MWLKVPTDFCHYISIASHYGFQFHHTQPKYIMMYLWLPEDVPDKVPAYGTHHLGVAGAFGCSKCTTVLAAAATAATFESKKEQHETTKTDVSYRLNQVLRRMAIVSYFQQQQRSLAACYDLTNLASATMKPTPPSLLRSVKKKKKRPRKKKGA